MRWWRKKEREQDLERELRSDLELEAEEQQKAGLSPEQAGYAARRAFGNTTSVREAARETWGWTSFERLGQDLRFAIRTLRKNPGFTSAAILTLALGIGANSAMFSLIDGVLLRSLPYPDANRIAVVHVHFSPQNTEYGTMSIADYLDWKSRNHAFEDPAIFSNGSWRFDLTGVGEPVEVKGCAVSANFFAVLRTGPMLGRVFHSGESAPTATPEVVLSEALWRNHFGANRAVLGRAVNLSGTQAVVIGIMPSTFHFPADQGLWTNIRLRPPTRRGPFPYIGVARLKPGVSFAQAQAETNAIGLQIERANPGNYHGMTMPVLPLREALTGKSRPALLVMFGAVFLVLLIAIANVANLMLVRSGAREREMAIRLGLGAARGRIVRQLLTESVLLGSIGGLGGLALAWVGISALRARNPGNLPRIEEVHLDVRVLAFTFFVSVLTGILFGLAPAFRNSRSDLNGILKQGGRIGSVNLAKRRAHAVLVIAEVALAFMLLVGGGLLLRSFVQLQAADAGFRSAPQQVLAIGVVLSRSSTRSPDDMTFQSTRYARILDRVRSLPGVIVAAFSDSLPPDRRADYDTFQIEGQPWTESGFPAVTVVLASPDYFRTLGVPLLEGRYFTQADAANSPGAIIISESLARRYFHDSNPVGRHIAPSGPDNHNRWLPIVGVVGDVKYTGLDSQQEPAYYPLYAEFSGNEKLNLVVRSTIAASLPHQLRREIRAIDPGATLSDIETLEAVRSASISQPRFRTALIAGFAGVALLLSAIGVYGVMAYSVVQRTNEIGIRIALGARRDTVLRQIIRHGAFLALAGIAIGLVGALLLTRVLSGLLFATSATDPATFAAVAMLLAVIALLASLIPAVRATKIDPVIALRYE
ncbi:MAG TPA: ABC transporter permease [Bryobacteraceae bacterium]|nr:ABC transporter permease [Bryobacteraceae bacterium]